MEKLRMIEELKNKVNISHEEAENALENNQWDILDAIVYLEQRGVIRKPVTSVFYTNQYEKTHSNTEVLNLKKDEKDNNSKHKKRSEGFFEVVCKIIDNFNNIFIEIRRHGDIILKIPVTVLILLVFFAFWMIIPLIIVGFIFDIEFFVKAKCFNPDKVNEILAEISKNIKLIKAKIKKGNK